MPTASMIELLEAGVHFGHQTQRWNPKMKPYIYGARNGIYVIDLRKTTDLLDEAYNLVRDFAAKGKNVLFVGTKKQAAEVVAEEAKRSGAYYINRRWLGGMLTNFETIRGRVNKLKEMEEFINNGYIDKLPKKEVAQMCPFEWQSKENIVYCDYLEHLLLHVLICKYPSNAMADFINAGIGGIVEFIVPELNDLYSGWLTNQTWRKNCHDKVSADKEVYLEILGSLLKL